MNMQVGDWKKASGFTIVELLIVVVVIAILASITIVSYNGIQGRAHDTAVQSDLQNMVTFVEIYRATNGRLPRDTDFANMGLKVSTGSYSDTLLINGSTKYNLLYCSPTLQDDVYTFVAQSKSGKVFKNGTAGNGEVASSGSSSSVTLCTEAGVATNGSTTQHRTFFYANGWSAWVNS